METTNLDFSWCRSALIVTISVAMALSLPGLAQAEPGTGPNSLAALIAEVAEANQQLQEVGAQVQTEQEGVNKAIVEVQDARDAASAAQQQLVASQQAIKDAGTAIVQAQKKFDTFAAATYVNGPSASLVMARTPEEIISSAAAGQAFALSSQQVMARLQQARTQAVNSEAAAREAKQKADDAVVNAQRSQDAAVAALTDAQKAFREQQAEIDRLAAERKEAQRKLEEARTWSAAAAVNKAAAAAVTPAPQVGGPAGQTAPEAGPVEPSPGDRWDGNNPSAVAKVPYGLPSQWDLTLPAVPSAFLSGDPVQIINAILGIAQNSFQVTQQLGKKFLQTMGILKPTDTGITNGGGIPLVYGNQAIEYVIKRAMSQIGVPYSWGGGNAAGPSRGIDDGANTVGFDCSGLILYAFAGVGIKLPHYSGSQYTAGTQVPSAQMRRGDAIFYGPGGSQHVALYLGDGKMLEAPYTGSDVHVSTVRTSGMTPFVTRYIQ